MINIGKLIVIEGTDKSGKETQTKLLVEKLLNNNIKAIRETYPVYDSPTGQLLKLYLGKEVELDLDSVLIKYADNKDLKVNHGDKNVRKITGSFTKGLFNEGATNVSPYSASLLFALDRHYHSLRINNLIEQGTLVICDRYVESNMAHQGSKFNNTPERLAFYQWIEHLEYKMLKIRPADLVIFLYMPYKYAQILREQSGERPDQHESSMEHLMAAEELYLDLANRKGFIKINCVRDDKKGTKDDIKTPEEISNEIFTELMNYIMQDDKDNDRQIKMC